MRPCQIRLLIATLLVGSWGAYLIALLPIELTDGAASWLVPLITALGLASGLMAIRAQAKWPIVMWVAASSIAFIHGLSWLSNVITLSDGSPDKSFLTLLGKVARMKLGLLRHIGDAEGWFGFMRHAIWELMPFLQVLIVSLFYFLGRLSQRHPSIVKSTDN